MPALGKGVEGFAFAVDKGFDYIPEKAFGTPQGRRKREEQQRREQQRQGEFQQQNNEGDDQPQRRRSDEQERPAPPPATSAYQQTPQTSPPPNYIQDPYAQDRGFSRSGHQSFSNGRFDNYDPHDAALTQKRDSMQNDGYYQPPYGDQRRSYNPSDYQPRDSGYDDRVGYRRDNASYGDSYSGRAASAGPRSDRYSGRYSDEDDDYREGRHDRKNRHRSGSRSSSDEGIRGKIGGHFDKTQHGLATGALGALAGGVLGHEIGGKKKSVWPTVAGVVIGGLGANALEARHEKRKSTREEDRRRTRSVDGGKHAYKGSYEDDYDDYQDRRSSRRGGDRDDYDDRRSGYDDRRSGYDDRYDRYER